MSESKQARVARFIPDYEIARAKPAAYNPRLLEPAPREELKNSLRRLGVIRPIIVTPENLILAGHQRTKTMLAVGITHCPAVEIVGGGLMDEVRFNQVHNAADKEETDGVYFVPEHDKAEFKYVDPNDIQELTIPDSGNRRDSIMKLISVHGEWGSVVATFSGMVIACQLYASSCYVMRRPLLVRYVPNELEKEVRHYFSQQYGKFDYTSFPDEPWMGTFAQPRRLRTQVGDGDGDDASGSRLWEDRVFPIMKPTDRILDFGAGQMDVANSLIRKGQKVFPVEFFFRKKGRMEYDEKGIHKHIDRMLADLRENGRFDICLADSVINSVVNVQGEIDVVSCLSAFCKPGGYCIFSTRSRENADATAEKHAKLRGTTWNLEYFDDNGFTMRYRHGAWTRQKFHRAEDVDRLARTYCGSRPAPGNHSGYHTTLVVKDFEPNLVEMRESIRREFDLPLPPPTGSLNRGNDAIAAWEASLAKEGITVPAQ